MSETITAGFFYVDATEETTVIEKLMAAYTNPKKGDYSVDYQSRQYRLTNAHWDVSTKSFAATIWKVRSTQLPSKLTGSQAVHLDIGPDEDLGEPASLAYIPSRALAIVQYNHSGPRYPLLREYMFKAGVQPDVLIGPILTRDATSRLKQAGMIRKMEFSLSDPKDSRLKPLRKDGSISQVLDAAANLGGVKIRVTVSMGHERGSLTQDAREAILALANSVVGVECLRATVKETDDSSSELLDFLGARQTIKLDVPARGREIDHARCRERLLRALRSYKP